ncbi:MULTISPECIES: caspase family protein [unclassified Neorhizobium]|uniref:caspase family protein n=1 Tax=unclassified Neorhizobium TaxID=2629175 RepID=UPI001FF16411|nr:MULTISPECIES: caspase family protein [unclassified Neorhizobium]MCJ9669472.1 caspase family protein [Neorhizobium sp. SHOUNA12B]MCJ9745504.1 caspase family protein [Neorhizobium sp. SHOUNA12A]
MDVPEATLANIKAAMLLWHPIIQCHPDNMIVFYFCGHGISLGQKAALLLNDFGHPATPYDAAIELDELTGTLKNAIAVKQLFLIDCCRSKADNIYSNETRVGSRVLSMVSNGNHNGVRRRQCVIFPTIDGEQAFGVSGQVSVFTTCFLDAVRFAAFDDKTGRWVSTSLLILNAIDELVTYRLPTEKRNKAVPTSLDAMGFEFNEIEAPTRTRSIVTIDDRATWSEARLTAIDVGGTNKPGQTFDVPNNHTYRCCTMELEFGEWEFSGKLAVEPPSLSVMRRYLTRPMIFVRLGVQ